MNDLTTPQLITKVFSLMVWTEMDRVRTGQRFYTVTITGAQDGQPEGFQYEVDGKPATMEDAAHLLRWARNGGSVEQVAQEVAA